jgi:hypothetical protein
LSGSEAGARDTSRSPTTVNAVVVASPAIDDVWLPTVGSGGAPSFTVVIDARTLKQALSPLADVQAKVGALDEVIRQLHAMRERVRADQHTPHTSPRSPPTGATNAGTAVQPAANVPTPPLNASATVSDGVSNVEHNIEVIVKAPLSTVVKAELDVDKSAAPTITHDEDMKPSKQVQSAFESVLVNNTNKKTTPTTGGAHPFESILRQQLLIQQQQRLAQMAAAVFAGQTAFGQSSNGNGSGSPVPNMLPFMAHLHAAQAAAQQHSHNTAAGGNGKAH